MKRQPAQLSDTQAAMAATALVCVLCILTCTWITTSDLGDLVSQRQLVQEHGGPAQHSSWTAVAGRTVHNIEHNIEQLPEVALRPFLSHSTGAYPACSCSGCY